MRISARIETAKPPDLKEINQIAKSIGRIGARIGAGVRHEISQLLPKPLINYYVSSKNAKSAHLAEKSIGGPERGLKRRGAAIQEKSIKWRNQLGGSERGQERRSPFPIPELTQSIRELA